MGLPIPRIRPRSVSTHLETRDRSVILRHWSSGFLQMLNHRHQRLSPLPGGGPDASSCASNAFGFEHRPILEPAIRSAEVADLLRKQSILGIVHQIQVRAVARDFIQSLMKFIVPPLIRNCDIYVECAAVGIVRWDKIPPHPPSDNPIQLVICSGVFHDFVINETNASARWRARALCRLKSSGHW